MAEGGRARPSRKAVGLGLLVLALGPAAGACGAPAMTVSEFERRSGLAAPVQPEPASIERPAEVVSSPELGGLAPAAQGQPATEPSDPSYGFGDGAALLEVVRASLTGERSLLEVVLYEGYGIVTTSEPATGHIERVVVRGRGVQPPTEVPETAVTDLERSRFVSTDVDWSIVPGLVERTPRDLGVDGGTVSHVIVEKNLPFTPDLVIRVYVEGGRGGRIDYFADGRPMRSYPS